MSHALQQVLFDWEAQGGEMAVSDEEIPDAPYVYLWEEGIVDGEKCKVYLLGKFGKQKLDAAAQDIAEVKRELRRIHAKIELCLTPITPSCLLAVLTWAPANLRWAPSTDATHP